MKQSGSKIREQREQRCSMMGHCNRYKSGYMVYLAYQLVDSITFSQVMVETLLYGVDIEQKKKDILNQLEDQKMFPALNYRIRKNITGVKNFMRNDQVELVHHFFKPGGRNTKKIEQVGDMLVSMEKKQPQKNYQTVDKKEQTAARRECLCRKN